MSLQRLFTSIVLTLTLVFGFSAQALDTKSEQLAAMETFLSELITHYGMSKFKYETFGVSIESLRAKYSGLIQNAQTLEELNGLDRPVAREILSRRQFQQLMISMIAELRDGHSNNSRKSHEMWTLGLRSTAIDGRLYISGKNKDLFVEGTSRLPVKLWDEVLEVNGVSVQELAKRNLPYMQEATYENRSTDALMFLLTIPETMLNPNIKEGDPVTLKLRRGEETFEVYLNWISFRQYERDRARHRTDFDWSVQESLQEEGDLIYGITSGVKSLLRSGILALALPEGSITDVGSLINLEIDKAEKSSAKKKATEALAATPEKDPIQSEGTDSDGVKSNEEVRKVTRLQAYIVNYKGKRIGVLRVPSYSTGDPVNELRWIAKALKKFQNSADVVILDLLSNGGGYVFYGTNFVAMLAGKDALTTMQANTRLSETLVHQYNDSAPAHDDMTGRRVNYGADRILQSVAREWERKYNAGEKWTGLEASFNNVFNSGVVGKVVPNQNVDFTLPTIAANDKYSASGGDFVPRLGQISKRWMVMGETSRGLGGPVYRSIDSMPGSEMAFRCTMAYCQTEDGQPIENVGTVPDLFRPVRIQDLRDNGKAYATDFLEAALMLANKKSPEQIKKALVESRKKREVPKPLAKKVRPVLTLVEQFKASTEFKTTNDNFTGDPRGSIAIYKKLAEDLIAKGKDLKPEDWHAITFPLPSSLMKSDVMLAALWKRNETIERLEELKNLPRFKRTNLNDVSTLWMVERFAEILKTLPPEIRVADLCEMMLLSSAAPVTDDEVKMKKRK